MCAAVDPQHRHLVGAVVDGRHHPAGGVPRVEIAVGEKDPADAREGREVAVVDRRKPPAPGAADRRVNRCNDGTQHESHSTSRARAMYTLVHMDVDGCTAAPGTEYARSQNAESGAPSLQQLAASLTDMRSFISEWDGATWARARRQCTGLGTACRTCCTAGTSGSRRRPRRA